MGIRQYDPKDKKQIKRLVISVLKEIFNSAKGIEDLGNIENEFEVFFVAEKDGEIIGTLGIKNEGDARISRMYVKKTERGSGIGEELMKRAFRYCQGKFERMFLTTYPQMNSASFYHKMGFKEFKRDERIWMEKRI